MRRDDVRLLVARRTRGTIEHARFSDLPTLLEPGDLLVVNVSATLPAACEARWSDGTPARVHFATRAPQLDASWRVVELRSADGARPAPARVGDTLTLRGGATLQLAAPYATSTRLVLARFEAPLPLEQYLTTYGEPIRYGYTTRSWPLEAYQNVYALNPGSAEMPSAGRPFTPELIVALLSRGITIAPITLHCGVSSPERHEPPFPEWFEVPDHTARLVKVARRVIAVGTTVVRALESPSITGWTNRIISPERPPNVVHGLITGWHEPAASHLNLLEAIAGPDLLARSYTAALEHSYLWHEFGDSHLILPD
jgi:S-adenosylmethionine:tRNA ribosyltransferase-isomerase